MRPFSGTFLIIGSFMILGPLILFSINKVSSDLFVTATAIGIFIVIASVLFPPQTESIYEEEHDKMDK